MSFVRGLHERGEEEIFYSKLISSKGPYNYLNDSEIEDIIQLAWVLRERTFNKKDELWFWHQLIITHFLSVQCDRNIYGMEWDICSEDSLRDFLDALYFYYKKYTHIHSKNINDNIYIKVATNMTTIAQENLKLSNATLLEIYNLLQKFSSSSPKKTHEWEEFWNANQGIIDSNTNSERCSMMLYLLQYGRLGVPYRSCHELFYTSFTGYQYSNFEDYLRSYRCSIISTFLSYLKSLIIFSYSYNKNGWVIPKEKRSSELNKNVEFIKSVYKYKGGDIKILMPLIEEALPSKQLIENGFSGSQILMNLQDSKSSLKTEVTPIKSYFECLDVQEIDDALQINCTELTHKVMNKLSDNKKITRTRRLSPISGSEEYCYIIRKSDWSLIREELYKIIPRDDLKEPEKVEEKPTFKFSLFGYELSLTKKKELPKPVDLSDEFPDEVEY